MALALIPVTAIRANPDQPRKNFDADGLRELANSIRATGLQQPITLRPIGGGYEIVAGERRFRACKMLGLEAIPALVREMSDRQRDIEAIVENAIRLDVTPLEEARAYQRLVDQGMSVADISTAVGRAARYIEERVRLLRLRSDLLQLTESGQLPHEAALEISKLQNHRDQEKVFRMVQSGKIRGRREYWMAVQTILDNATQVDIFGDMAPKASDDEIKTVSRMEQKIDSVVSMVATGWKDGECVIASKVAPDKARLMSDKIAAIKKALSVMEAQLRDASAQVAIVMQAAE